MESPRKWIPSGYVGTVTSRAFARAQQRTITLLSFAWILWLVSGCALGRTSTTERETALGQSQSTSFGVHGSSVDAALARGRQAVMDGRFEEATATFSEVVETTSASDEQRAEALFELGRVHTSVLNPKRDMDSARVCYQRVIDEYPDSKLRPDAEKNLQRLSVP